MTEKRERRIVKIAVHYRHASQSPECRPIGTLTAHAHANFNCVKTHCVCCY